MADWATISILGEDLVTGRTLELLLRSFGYDARFLDDPFSNGPGFLNGTEVLLLLPELSTERRRALLALVGSTPGTAKLQILKLVENPEEAQAGPEHSVLWPCWTEELVQRIEAALLAGSGADRAPYEDTQAPQ